MAHILQILWHFIINFITGRITSFLFIPNNWKNTLSVKYDAWIFADVLKSVYLFLVLMLNQGLHIFQGRAKRISWDCTNVDQGSENRVGRKPQSCCWSVGKRKSCCLRRNDDENNAAWDETMPKMMQLESKWRGKLLVIFSSTSNYVSEYIFKNIPLYIQTIFQSKSTYFHRKENLIFTNSKCWWTLRILIHKCQILSCFNIFFEYLSVLIFL